MSSKDRDLEVLEKFQRDFLAFCQQIEHLAQQLRVKGEEACVSLQDDVSKVSLHRVEFIADKLTQISGYGQQEITTALARTRAELDHWNNL